MIDFENARIIKLHMVKDSAFDKTLEPILTEGEEISAVYKTVRDGVVFTNKRVISINIQGVTGSKKCFTTLPYSKVQAFAVETPGSFDLDSELCLWFSGGIGKITFEFDGGANVTELCGVISARIL
jgi:hypothetical protein